MAFNGSGTFVRLYSWVTDRNAGTKIRADKMDDEDDGFASGLSNCITRDGQTTITDDIPWSNNKITGLATPTASTDAATKGYVDTQAAAANSAGTVTAATTANITIATALNNGDSLDGITLATGDVVLVKDQTAAAENGIYLVGTTPARTEFFDTYDENSGAMVTVQEGTVNKSSVWQCVSPSGGTLETTDIDWVQTSTPVGTIMDFAGLGAPAGWLECYGQAISRTNYTALFHHLGTAFGVGDGSTTFNLPDLRGRVVAGLDDMGGTSADRLTSGSAAGLDGDTRAATGGVEEHQLTEAELAAHTHSYTRYNNTNTGGGAAFTTADGFSGNTTGSTGGDAAHTNVQPTIIMTKIIYAGV